MSSLVLVDCSRREGVCRVCLCAQKMHGVGLCRMRRGAEEASEVSVAESLGKAVVARLIVDSAVGCSDKQ